MSERNSFKVRNIDPNLNDQQFILNKINDVKDYITPEIKERELISKRVSKYVASSLINI